MQLIQNGTTYEVSISPRLMARDGKPTPCAHCGQDSHYFYRVHLCRSLNAWTFHYAFPVYAVCNKDCAYQAASADIATGLVHFR